MVLDQFADEGRRSHEQAVSDRMKFASTVRGEERLPICGKR